MARDIREFGLEPDPVIEAYKKDVDRTLIREMLKKTIDERLQALEQMALLHEEFGNRAKRPRSDDAVWSAPEAPSGSLGRVCF